MRRLIGERFPDHGIIGEEYGPERARCRVRLGARPDRRHQVLHHRAAAVRHADRPAASTAVRSSASSTSRSRASAGSAPRAAPTTFNGARGPLPRLRRHGRGDLFSTSPDMFRGADAAAHARLAGAAKLRALRRRLLRLWAGRARLCRPGHRSQPQAIRFLRDAADRRGRRRGRHRLAGSAADRRLGRPRRCGGRPARARRGARAVSRLSSPNGRHDAQAAQNARILLRLASLVLSLSLGAAGAAGCCRQPRAVAVRRPEIRAGLQAFRLRQPGCAEGRRDARSRRSAPTTAQPVHRQGRRRRPASARSSTR